MQKQSEKLEEIKGEKAARQDARFSIFSLGAAFPRGSRREKLKTRDEGWKVEKKSLTIF